jgi:hypothetical protein
MRQLAANEKMPRPTSPDAPNAIRPFLECLTRPIERLGDVVVHPILDGLTFDTALSALNDRERRIFEARRLAEEPITLDELADEFGVSRERVRQIGACAFEKVQKAVKNRVVMMETPAPLPAFASNPVPWREKLPIDVSPWVRFTATGRCESGTTRRSTHRILRHSPKNL